METEYCIHLGNVLNTIKQSNKTRLHGRVDSIIGPIVRARLNAIAIGSQARIERIDGTSIKAKVIGFEKELAILSPLGLTKGMCAGARIISEPSGANLLGGAHLLGSVFNGKGELISPGSAFSFNYESKPILLENDAPAFDDLEQISEIFHTGIRAIDGFLTLGKGQRITIFAEPGVGKTSLLGCISQNSSADVNVIALIGERGREVRAFIEDILDEETRKKSIIIASTSADSAVARTQAALLATGIAEYFRDCNKDVLLIMDSLTRLFRSYRELGLAAGESPVRGVYPPSVFEQIPKLIERSGRTKSGSITSIYSVLLSGNIDEDPMAEEVKGLCDGHIILRKELAERGQFPAISILESISRLQPQLVTTNHEEARRMILMFKSEYEEKKDLLLFAEGKEKELSVLHDRNDLLEKFIRQEMTESIEFSEMLNELVQLGQDLRIDYKGV